MSNFNELDPERRQGAWEAMKRRFQFRPGQRPIDWPGVRYDGPTLRFNLLKCYQPEYSTDNLRAFQKIAFRIFRKLVAPGQSIIAPGYHQRGYVFDPHQTLRMRGESIHKYIPVFPRETYTIFLNEAHTQLWFGHPHEQTLTLMGAELVEIGRTFQPRLATLSISVLEEVEKRKSRFPYF